MTTTTMTVTDLSAAPADARLRRFGIFSVLLAVATFVAFGLGADADTAKFDLNLGESYLALPDVTLPVTATVVVLSLLIGLIGAGLLAGRIQQRAVLALAIALLAFVFAFLTWAAAGTQLNLVSLLRGTVRLSVPLTFGALAGVMCERAGEINIAIEAQLLTAAFGAAVGASLASNPWVGLLIGIALGGLLGWVLAVLAIRYRADQIIVGVVLVVFATGLTSFLLSQLLVPNAHWNAPTRFRPIDLPVVSELPILGPLVFRQSVVVYLMFATVLGVNWLLFRTRFGLRIRAVGEHPKAADTVGVDVERTRYLSVIIGGMIAGIGGAYFTLDSAAQFSREMSGGRGFIALAAMLVGRYHPVGAFAAALIFGFADSVATGLSIVGVPIPSDFLLMAPYLVTILVVAGIVGRVRLPAADGQPYVKE